MLWRSMKNCCPYCSHTDGLVPNFIRITIIFRMLQPEILYITSTYLQCTMITWLDEDGKKQCMIFLKQLCQVPKQGKNFCIKQKLYFL